MAIVQAGPQGPRRYRALLIGVWDYAGLDEVFTRLTGPENDVKRMKQALSGGRGALFRPEDVLVVENPEQQPMRLAINTFLTQSRPNDTVLLYYSGHGELDQRGETLFFCPREVTKQQLAVSGVDASEISKWLDRDCPASQKIVILDCCYSGGFKSGDLDLQRRVDGEGRFTMTASGASTRARDGAEISPFTELVVRGLETLADDQLTVLRLAEWVAEQARTKQMPMPEYSVRDARGGIVIRGAGPEMARRAEQLPVLRLRFADHGVEVSMPEQELRSLGPLMLSGPGSPHHNLLSELDQLSATEAVWKDVNARGMLDRALATTRTLAGQVLFDEVFDDELREAYGALVLAGKVDPRLEVQLDLTDAPPDVVQLPWEYLSQLDSRGPSRIGDRVAMMSRAVASGWHGSGWKGDGPIVGLVHSQFNEDHPLSSSIRGELETVVERTGPLRAMAPVSMQPSGEWIQLVESLERPETNLLVLLGELREIGGEAVLRINEQEPLRETAIADELVPIRGRLGLPAPELIILEAVASPVSAEKAFGLTSAFARALSAGCGCPVVAVSHSAAYLAWLKEEIDRRKTGAAPVLRTLTGNVVEALRAGKSVERCVYEARQAIARSRTPMSAPLVYLPILEDAP